MDEPVLTRPPAPEPASPGAADGPGEMAPQAAPGSSMAGRAPRSGSRAGPAANVPLPGALPVLRWRPGAEPGDGQGGRPGRERGARRDGGQAPGPRAAREAGTEARTAGGAGETPAAVAAGPTVLPRLGGVPGRGTRPASGSGTPGRGRGGPGALAGDGDAPDAGPLFAAADLFDAVAAPALERPPAPAPFGPVGPGTAVPLIGLLLLALIWTWRALTPAVPPTMLDAGGNPAEVMGAPATGASGGGGEAQATTAVAGGGTGPGEAPAEAGAGTGAGGGQAAGSGAAGSGAAHGDGPEGAAPGGGPPAEGGTAAAPGSGLEYRAGTAPPGAGAAMVVHVAGAVRHPGVYRVPAGARVLDAVEAAGGPAAGAALHALNLAAVLADGSRVEVPTQADVAAGRFVPVQGGSGPAPPPATGGDSAGGARLRVNINRAGQEELEQLPGIGPALAQRILADREVNGPFRRPQDLARVEGIGEKKLGELLPYVTTGP